MHNPSRQFRCIEPARDSRLTISPDQHADRALALCYWDDDPLAIIAKGFVVADNAGSRSSLEVQS